MAKEIWDALEARKQPALETPIVQLFSDDPRRFEDFSVLLDDMVLDYSKTTIDRKGKELLIQLAESSRVARHRDAMFEGEKINSTEGRAVLHTALRNRSDSPVIVAGEDVMPGVRRSLRRMTEFAEGVRTGSIGTWANEKFTDVVNIGIGGSDLGPSMATQALSPYHDGPRVHFVSNVDGSHIGDTLKKLEARTTLIIVASKTFTTIETMTNANSARHWMESTLGQRAGEHFVAISSADDRALEFGISAERTFGFEDWVGGRYSIWGPIGLSLMLAIGGKQFANFLEGGYEMDRHFRVADFDSNLPVLLGLVGIWHRNICDFPSRAVLPYDQRLSQLPSYLQQLDMESNGKRISLEGIQLAIPSGPLVWGAPGTNGQHAFYQLLHQGTDVVPCEFLVAASGFENNLRNHHDLLVANCLAQSEALMCGRTTAEAREILREQGKVMDYEPDKIAEHRSFPGNRPSITLLYPKLTPKVLGKIIALYEHRVFVEGCVWGINSFDQWGVELGKELAANFLPLIKGKGDASTRSQSTAGLINSILEMRNRSFDDTNAESQSVGKGTEGASWFVQGRN